jgi:hypothetical protein
MAIIMPEKPLSGAFPDNLNLASILIWGCTGFDGGVEAWIAGGGVALLKTASL